MEALINDFVTKHFAVWVLACIVIAAIFALVLWFIYSYWTFKKTAKCEENCKRIGALEQVTSGIPCKSHGEKIERHSLSVCKIETSLDFITKSIETVNAQLQRLSETKPLTQQHSPLTITQRGWEIVSKLGMDKMFDANWARIKESIDEEVADKNAYDINEYCIKHAVVYPEKFLHPEEISILKSDAYLQGFTLTDYMKIIAVMARDRYFRETGIKAE